MGGTAPHTVDDNGLDRPSSGGRIWYTARRSRPTVVRMETPKLRALRRAVRMVSGPVTLNDSEMAES